MEETVSSELGTRKKIENKSVENSTLIGVWTGSFSKNKNKIKKVVLKMHFNFKAYKTMFFQLFLVSTPRGVGG